MLIVHTLPVGPFQANSFVLKCSETGDGVIVDPGDEDELILEVAEREGVNVKYIFLTHAHVDHVGAVLPVHESTGAPVLLHKDDEFLLERVGAQALSFGLSVEGPGEVDVFIEDGNVYRFGTLEAKVIHTPGHSPGGVCYLIGKTLFAGDTLFAGSIGRTDLPGGSYDTLISSIKEKLLPLCDDVEVHTGHGPSTTLGEERLTNPFLRSGFMF
jgi:glyoxylase-like metal-dependent hydrolase (beta-lactamase superfamily II)